MKTTHVCPKCQSRRIGHLDQVVDVADQSVLQPQHIGSRTTSDWVDRKNKLRNRLKVL